MGWSLPLVTVFLAQVHIALGFEAKGLEFVTAQEEGASLTIFHIRDPGPRGKHQPNATSGHFERNPRSSWDNQANSSFSRT